MAWGRGLSRLCRLPPLRSLIALTRLSRLCLRRLFLLRCGLASSLPLPALAISSGTLAFLPSRPSRLLPLLSRRALLARAAPLLRLAAFGPLGCGGSGRLSWLTLLRGRLLRGSALFLGRPLRRLLLRRLLPLLRGALLLLSTPLRWPLALVPPFLPLRPLRPGAIGRAILPLFVRRVLREQDVPSKSGALALRQDQAGKYGAGQEICFSVHRAGSKRDVEKSEPAFKGSS